MHSASFRSTFLRVLKFLQNKEGKLSFWVEPIPQNGWIIWSPLLYFNFKSFKDPNSSSFIRFQCILYDSGEFFSHFWDFYKLKIKDLVSGGKPILQNGWIIWSPVLYFILKVSSTQILCHSLDINVSVWFRSTFLRSFKFPKIKEGGPTFLWGNNSAERLNYLVPFSVFQF